MQVAILKNRIIELINILINTDDAVIKFDEIYNPIYQLYQLNANDAVELYCNTLFRLIIDGTDQETSRKIDDAFSYVEYQVGIGSVYHDKISSYRYCLQLNEKN